jgi:hypothetical protein
LSISMQVYYYQWNNTYHTTMQENSFLSCNRFLISSGV